MSLMCSQAVCKEKAGVCPHEKVTAGVVVLIVVGFVAGRDFGLF
jgi:hypothetical protein